jgi:hypothetical protein
MSAEPANPASEKGLLVPDPPDDQPLSEELLAKLGTADPDELREMLHNRPELLRADVIAQLAEAVRRSLRVDVDYALRLAGVAVLLAEKLGDANSMGLGLRAKANALWFRNDLHSATNIFEQAVTWFEKAANDEEIGRTLMRRSDAH